MKHSFKEYVLATRPWSFPASAMPVVVTIACMFAQHEQVRWWLGVWALFTIILVHAAGNVWSDYFDFKKKVDQEDTYGTKILTSGQFKPKETMRLSIILQVIAFVSGISLIAVAGWPLLWVGLTGLALSLLYPPLKYMALGDVVIYFCYAFLPMIGTSYAVTGEIHWDMLWLSVPVGLITISILHANNTRDIETDNRVHIKTFAMLLGRDVSALLYCLEVLLPFVWMTVLALLSMYSLWTMLVWIVFPMSLMNMKMMMGYKKKGITSYAMLDEASAKLQLAFSLLLSIGFVLSHYLG